MPIYNSFLSALFPLKNLAIINFLFIYFGFDLKINSTTINIFRELRFVLNTAYI